MDIAIQVGKYIIDHAPELSGVILPPVVDYIGKDVKNSNERLILTLLVCFVVAMLLNWNRLLYGSIYEVFTSFGLIYSEAHLVFKLYFKDSNLRLRLNGDVSNNKEGDDTSSNTKLQQELTYTTKKDTL